MSFPDLLLPSELGCHFAHLRTIINRGRTNYYLNSTPEINVRRDEQTAVHFQLNWRQIVVNFIVIRFLHGENTESSNFVVPA